MSDVNVVDVLKGAKALVERGWCQDDWAKDGDGCGRYWDDPKLCAFCADAALRKTATDAEWFNAARLLTQAIGSHASSVSIWKWNDAPERTQAEVVAAFERAIELAQAEATHD